MTKLITVVATATALLIPAQAAQAAGSCRGAQSAAAKLYGYAPLCKRLDSRHFRVRVASSLSEAMNVYVGDSRGIKVMVYFTGRVYIVQ